GETEAAPTQTQALAELMAAVASQARTEAEAEAMAGAATVSAISPADRAALRVVLPHLVRGTAILTRILRQRRITRPAVRAVPTSQRRLKDSKEVVMANEYELEALPELEGESEWEAEGEGEWEWEAEGEGESEEFFRRILSLARRAASSPALRQVGLRAARGA